MLKYFFNIHIFKEFWHPVTNVKHIKSRPPLQLGSSLERVSAMYSR